MASKTNSHFKNVHLNYCGFSKRPVVLLAVLLVHFFKGDPLCASIPHVDEVIKVLDVNLLGEVQVRDEQGLPAAEEAVKPDHFLVPLVPEVV